MDPREPQGNRGPHWAAGHIHNVTPTDGLCKGAILTILCETS